MADLPETTGVVEVQWPQIATYFDQGLTTQQIANLYGVTEAEIYNGLAAFREKRARHA
jgi:transposase